MGEASPARAAASTRPTCNRGRTGRGAAVVMKAASSPGRFPDMGDYFDRATAAQHLLVPEGSIILYYRF